MILAAHRKTTHWLPAGPPGRRFRNHYYANQRTRRRGRILAMVLRFFLSTVAAAIGFVLVFLPGPAIVFFVLAGALLAADWLPVARVLDWAEVRARWRWHCIKRLWRRLSRPTRVALGIATATAGVAAGCGVYLVLR